MSQQNIDKVVKLACKPKNAPPKPKVSLDNLYDEPPDANSMWMSWWLRLIRMMDPSMLLVQVWLCV